MGDDTTSQLALELGAFGTRLDKRRPPLCPELELWLLGDDVDLEVACEELGEGEAPPFWAFWWISAPAPASLGSPRAAPALRKCSPSTSIHSRAAPPN
jgi:hypothetical protein